MRLPFLATDRGKPANVKTSNRRKLWSTALRNEKAEPILKRMIDQGTTRSYLFKKFETKAFHGVIKRLVDANEGDEVIFRELRALVATGRADSIAETRDVEAKKLLLDPITGKANIEAFMIQGKSTYWAKWRRGITRAVALTALAERGMRAKCTISAIIRAARETEVMEKEQRQNDRTIRRVTIMLNLLRAVPSFGVGTQPTAVLNVGCGGFNGGAVPEVHEISNLGKALGCSAYAVDTLWSPKEAPALPDLTYCQVNDWTALPFPDCCFDVICLLMVMHRARSERPRSTSTRV